MAASEPHEPLLLAVDTAMLVGSLALTRGKRLLAEFSTAQTAAHSRLLLVELQAILQQSGLSPAQIELYAVGLGPGSFTGVRVALATMRTLAWVHHRPLIGIGTLDVLAAAAPAASHDTLVVPVMDARRGEVYAAAYRRDARGLQTELAPLVVTPDELLRQLFRIDAREYRLFGTGIAAFPKVFQTGAGPGLIVDETISPWPQAPLLANLAWQRWQENPTGGQPASVQPLYLRPSEAERAQRVADPSP